MNVAISLSLYLAICCTSVKTLKEGGREGLRGGVSVKKKLSKKKLGECFCILGERV